MSPRRQSPNQKPSKPKDSEPKDKDQARVARGGKAHTQGARAEFWAALWLTAKFYRIIGERVKTKAGEIDLIARRGDFVVFVEVKSSGSYERAVEALGAHQQARLARAAALYVAARPNLQNLDMRFDMVLVVKGRRPRHIVDAWRP